MRLSTWTESAVGATNLAAVRENVQGGRPGQRPVAELKAATRTGGRTRPTRTAESHDETGSHHSTSPEPSGSAGAPGGPVQARKTRERRHRGFNTVVDYAIESGHPDAGAPKGGDQVDPRAWTMPHKQLTAVSVQRIKRTGKGN